MKKYPTLLSVIILIGTFSIGFAQTKTNSLGGHSLLKNSEVDAAIKVLDSWILATMKSREQPGLSIGIVYDQDLIWAKGYGFADLAKQLPPRPSTIYRIASISKLFTSTAIMQLRDAAKLQLDNPIAKHLSWFKIKNAYPTGPTITIRHLLTHTSGLPREAQGVSWNELTFPTRQEMIQWLPDQKAVLPAETEWKYSNLALSLAGEIVTVVSGKSWAQYIESHILKPLGMTNTSALPEPNMPGLAIGYGRRVPGQPRDVEPFVDIKAERPAGNMASSVEDLAKFVSLQLREGLASGKQILKEATLHEMHRVHWLRPDWQSGWGIGFAIRRVDDQVRVGHGGSLPGHRTLLEFAPDIKLGIIVLTNANDGNPGLYLNKAFEIVGPAITQATSPPKVASVPEPEFNKYVGTYTWKHSDIQILILNGELTMIDPESHNPWESRIILELFEQHTFRARPIRWSYWANGELLTFELDESGRVKSLGTQNFYWVRK
ncbi:MAG: serine hydrolase [Nitrosomonadaceae bacterium]